MTRLDGETLFFQIVQSCFPRSGRWYHLHTNSDDHHILFFLNHNRYIIQPFKKITLNGIVCDELLHIVTKIYWTISFLILKGYKRVQRIQHHHKCFSWKKNVLAFVTMNDTDIESNWRLSRVGTIVFYNDKIVSSISLFFDPSSHGIFYFHPTLRRKIFISTSFMS